MSFKGQLKAFADKSSDNMRLATKKVLIDVGTRIVERTPVGDATLWSSPPPKGYVGGRARGSWQYGLNTPAAKETTLIDPSGAVVIARLAKEIDPVPGLHYITNSLPYIVALENGYSKQAPQGMVGLVSVEFGGIVDVAVRGLK